MNLKKYTSRKYVCNFIKIENSYLISYCVTNWHRNKLGIDYSIEENA